MDWVCLESDVWISVPEGNSDQLATELVAKLLWDDENKNYYSEQILFCFQVLF